MLRPFPKTSRLLETHPASQSVDTKGAFYRAQRAGDEVDQSFPSKAKIVKGSAAPQVTSWHAH